MEGWTGALVTPGGALPAKLSSQDTRPDIWSETHRLRVLGWSKIFQQRTQKYVKQKGSMDSEGIPKTTTMKFKGAR